MILNRETVISLDRARETLMPFGDGKVSIFYAPRGHQIDVSHDLLDPNDFHGSPLVHYVVRFGAAFAPLITTDQRRPIDPMRDRQNGLRVLEHTSEDAHELAEHINKLAEQFIADPGYYNSRPACARYFTYCREGYRLLRESLTRSKGLDIKTLTPVSLERGGLVCTRAALGADKNAVIPHEVRVSTKRTQMKGDRPTDLTVTVKFRHRQGVRAALQNAHILLADFVNPASGASTAALALAAELENARPAAINHLSIFATSQGINFLRRELGNKYDINTTYTTLGLAQELNGHYYLTDRPVGDAGHALRGYLPHWYRP